MISLMSEDELGSGGPNAPVGKNQLLDAVGREFGTQKNDFTRKLGASL